jgi:hypothetical protein
MARRPNPQKRRIDADSWLSHLQKHPIGQLFLLQRFLVMKLHAFGNPHLMPILKAVHLRIESYHGGLRNRVYGLVTGQQGHVLVLSVLGAGATDKKVAVTIPDGRTCTATVLGVDFHNDMTELQLPKDVKVPGIRLSPRWPRQAEMVLAINGGSPGIKWVHLCEAIHWRHAAPNQHGRRVENFRINSFFQMVHLPRFFIDVRGRLAAISSSNRGLVMGGKFSILRQFIATGLATGPRFGIKYKLLPPHSALRKAYPIIAARAAAEVQMVFPHTPAKWAGIKRHDILLTIDQIPVDQLHAIIQAARRRPDDIPVTLLRSGKLLHLTINLLPRRQPSPQRTAP